MANSNMHTCEKAAPGWGKPGPCKQCLLEENVVRQFAPPSTGPTVDACGKPMGTINGNPFACNRPNKHNGECSYTFPPVGYCCENGTFDTPHNCQKQPREAATSEGATFADRQKLLVEWIAARKSAQTYLTREECATFIDAHETSLRARLAEVEREREEERASRRIHTALQEKAEARVEELEKALRDIRDHSLEFDVDEIHYIAIDALQHGGEEKGK